MEKAILKTLAYFEIFEYPLTPWEVHKWLHQKKCQLIEVEEGIKKLEKKGKIEKLKGFHFLKGKRSLVKKRLEKEKISKSHLSEISSLSKLFKIIPWIKLVGISGSLSMKNSGKSDDIDLFLITKQNRLFLTRALFLLLLEVLGVRRKKGEKGELVYKKICINIILDERSLVQQNKSIYIAHEVLQMTPLWEREDIYTKYLSDNSWVFEYLPNWLTTGRISNVKFKKTKQNIGIKIGDFIESLFKNFQLEYMGKPTGKERILENAVYFLPDDNQEKVLNLYRQKTKNI